MDRTEIHRERIEPNKAPRGVWIRVCTIDRLLTEYAATDPRAMQSAAEVDVDLADASGAGVVWIYFYDGDTGDCMRTLIFGKGGERKN